MSDGSDMAKWIDAAHKLYRDAIGTPNEQPALDAFRGVVKYAQDVRDGKRELTVEVML